MKDIQQNIEEIKMGKKGKKTGGKLQGKITSSYFK